MNAITVAIIGMGPRGMTVLERLVSMGRRFPQLPLTVHIIDPGAMGCGVHQLRQPDYFLLNTVCGLPTMFPPRDHAADIEGETFFAWVRRQVHAKGMSVNDATDDDRDLRSSYLPRALFGAYLKACFEQIERQAPSNVELIVHACEAIALRRDASGECVECSNGTQMHVRFAVLTTGHTRNCSPNDGAVHDPYGFLAHLSERGLDSNDIIGLAGFGLSSFDVLAGLTVGRGGMFYRAADGELQYQTSGWEPLIYMFSRSGFPYLARPYRDCGTFFYDPLIFETNRIHSIRGTNSCEGLDFEATLLPLLMIELRAARCRMKLKSAGRPVSSDEWATLRVSDPTEIERWVDEVEHGIGAFDVFGFLESCNLALEGGATEYQQRFVELLEEDLRESRLGVERSERKYLAEVLLHLREGLNVAVDFGGLEPRSHDYFF
ncbi:FAD/NAD(P)-binding protein [Burkholderia oklahomensis]|nr:FAD/NAD(P)-binding protein [Burkholderia oklahomensis]